jgi:hypothetical protein
MDRSILGTPPFFPSVSINLDGYKITDLVSLFRTLVIT